MSVAEEARVVQLMFAYALARMTDSEIVERLSADGIKRRGQQWTLKEVERCLVDSAHMGRYDIAKRGEKGKLLSGQYTKRWDVSPTVAEVVWFLAQELREVRAPDQENRPRPDKATPLTGLLRCPCDGNVELGKGGGSHYFYYKCVGQADRGGCRRTWRNRSFIESQIAYELSFSFFSLRRSRRMLDAIVGADHAASVSAAGFVRFVETLQELFEERDPRFARRMVCLHVNHVTLTDDGFAIDYKPLLDEDWPEPLWYLNFTIDAPKPEPVRERLFGVLTHLEPSKDISRAHVQRLRNEADHAEWDVLIDATEKNDKGRRKICAWIDGIDTVHICSDYHRIVLEKLASETPHPVKHEDILKSVGTPGSQSTYLRTVIGNLRNIFGKKSQWIMTNRGAYSFVPQLGLSWAIITPK